MWDKSIEKIDWIICGQVRTIVTGKFVQHILVQVGTIFMFYTLQVELHTSWVPVPVFSLKMLKLGNNKNFYKLVQISALRFVS